MRVEQSVLEILDRAIINGNALELVGDLDRPTYVAVAKVIERAGGKWNKKAKAHLFDGEAADAIDQIILTGEVVSAKQEFGFFETPLPVVERILKIAEPKPADLALEPSAGRGAIASKLKSLCSDVMCIELQPAHGAALLSAGFTEHQVIVADFLAVDLKGAAFDVVAMNPPFARQADIRHVMHAAKLLRPGGRLVSVMSAGVKFRSDNLTRAFRDMVAARNGEIEDLPDGSFKQSGTNVNAVIVRIGAEGRS